MIFDEKRIIGKSDKADLPSWGLKNIPVKIDSGAYRSSIDCSFAKVYKTAEGRKLKFTLLRKDHPLYIDQVFETLEFKTSRVKSSNGENQKRYIVKTIITLFGKSYATEFSLSTRPDMRFPILLGRKLLNKKFVIDTSKTNLSFRSKTTKKKKIDY
jgi:hypothetical protein